MIDDYRFGSMTIQGRVYHQDVLIHGQTVTSPWWRRQGHRVEVEDLEEVLAAKPDILILGQGKPGMMSASAQLKRTLQEQGIQLVEEPSETAVHTFNRYVERGERVCGGFHLTC